MRDGDKMDIIEKCKDVLITDENIIFAYIFGSYAKNKLRKDSDLDLAVYLQNDIDTYDYLDMKRRLTEKLKREVDLIILNTAPPLLRYEIYKNNILLYTHSKTRESRYKVETLFQYSDMKKYLDLSYDKTIERLKEEVRMDG